MNLEGFARWIGFGRPPPNCAAVARQLFRVCVENDPLVAAVTYPANELSESLRPRFQSRWRLYREATVLALLRSREQRDARYSEIVKEYERLILASEQITPERLAKVADLDAAIKDINELIQSGTSGAELSWARNWFRELGEIPRKLVSCMIFGGACLRFWTTTEKTLAQMADDGILP